ncbi:hypothetical protein MRX96_021013, partial [Rhipicephalus microplus]
PLIHAYGVECVAFLSTPDADPTHPNIQFLLVTLNPTTVEAGYLAGLIGVSQIYENYYKRKHGDNVLMIVPALLRPKSSGYIRLRSTNPEEVLGGVKNLRVVDASSMPYLTAGNLNSPLMMMGHRAAAMIIEDNS